MVRLRLSLLALLLLVGPTRADETSTGDKLRILYSSRFTFTDDGLPLITVEIMGGQKQITLSAPGGLLVRPDGAGGSAVAAGDGRWTIRARDTAPAEIQEWTVVESLGPDDGAGAAAAIDRWKGRGFEPRTFEVGTLFGVDGELIDTRETLVAIDPVASPGGTARATQNAKRYGLSMRVHRELVRRPSGTIVAEGGGARVENPSVIWFEPARAGDTIVVDDVPVGTGGSQLQTSKETRRYWGRVYVTLDRGGALVAVNAVPEDKLLAGLVPAEMMASSPDAALEAQAIAARTELLAKLGHRDPTDPFLLCSTQACQVYAGAGHESPRTTRAVEKTRGLVMLRDGGGLADARYSASCGGHSEDNDWIWGGDPDPSLRGRPDTAEGGMSRVDGEHLDAFLDSEPHDSWCGRGKGAKGKFRWTEKVSAADLDARIAVEYPKVGHVLALVPDGRGVSGRIKSLTIKGDKGTAVADGDLHIRRLLGGLKSTLFKVTAEGPARSPTGWVFRGAGFGHGVGMCQTGAIEMAAAGKSRTEILGHYYRGTHLHRLY
ncbi:MAG: SpoIID/LytB domain-containing protein [Deltaproteobacteria bacterium]|nr:SpoIID/LytB domain-containing protein [Deltaproteobacteria bacterium]